MLSVICPFGSFPAPDNIIIIIDNIDNIIIYVNINVSDIVYFFIIDVICMSDYTFLSKHCYHVL